MGVSNLSVALVMAISLPLFAAEEFVLHRGLPHGEDQNGLFVHSLTAKTDKFLVDADQATIKIKSLYQGISPSEINGVSGTKIATTRFIMVRGASEFLDIKLFHKQSRNEYTRCDAEGCHYLGYHSDDGAEYWHPLATENIPMTAHIGEGGVIGYYQDEFKSEHHCQWSLAAVEGHTSQAQLKIVCDEIDDYHITENSVTTITINKRGQCLKVDFIVTDLDDDHDVTLGKGVCPQDNYFFRFL